MKVIRPQLFWHFIFASLLVLLFSCKKEEANPSIPLFNLRDSTTGIHFENTLVYDEQFNPYLYRNFYNGGGVALGDINNDGLIDIYFTGNIVDNKLFMNKGNWQFEDITNKAGVACPNVWSTGATFADINNDGLLDLYVCKAGKPEGSNRHNELFINNGDLTFTESSKEYGLDIEGLSVHSAFFDYDKDGDLDVYILNNSLRSIGGFDLKKDLRIIPDENGNKFLRNDNGRFIDITNQAGVFSSKIGFGLGITLGDFNNDNWTDIFISNDFFERDYLYINDTKGGFTENLEAYFESISMGSMGADLADLDNDMLPDLIVTEMLPATEERKKTKTLFESWDKQQLAEKQGYFNQFARNALQRNLGNESFLEVSRQANVSGTEWSWGALIFDMDNDGLKDIFISNGIFKDLLDRDYLAYDANEEKIRNRISRQEKNVITTLIDAMPSQAVANSVFRNKGNFNFENTAENWGLDTPSFSNGSAFGDLDNDGDLDLVVNNVNMPSFLYENTTDTLNQRSIQLELFDNNLRAIGAKALIKSKGKIIGYGENFVSRGFQSSVPYGLHFGVGNRTKIDSLIITWPNGSTSTETDLKTNRKYRFEQQRQDSLGINSSIKREKYPFQLHKINPLFPFEHSENRYIDFDNERLLPHMSSNEGPAMATADVNADGKPDFFVGGAKNQEGKLFVSNTNGYTELAAPFLKDAGSEDTDALFFDGDGDGDLDLYVCHGGKAFSPYSIELNDAYYINDGNSFTKSKSSPNFSSTFSSSVVTASDFDKDGDIDLFVGERYKTNLYGLPVSGYILENDGKGNFITREDPLFKNIGMITDAQWGDVNDDGWEDLLVVGEWMPIKVFINNRGIFEDHSATFGFSGSSGLWKAIELKDIDEDGDLDLIAGNIGRNAFYEKNMKMFIADFDGNGFQEQLICKVRNGKYYPIADKDELVSQIPSLKKKFLYYKDYAKADMTMIFSQEQLAKCYTAELDIIESMLFINESGSFKAKALPDEIQYAPVYAISMEDINSDGYQDLFLGGNQYMVKPQFGRYDASKGWAIFGPIFSQNSEVNVIPLFIEGQIRAMKWVDLEGKKILTIGKNNEEVLFYEFKDN